MRRGRSRAAEPRGSSRHVARNECALRWRRAASTRMPSATSVSPTSPIAMLVSRLPLVELLLARGGAEVHVHDEWHERAREHEHGLDDGVHQIEKLYVKTLGGRSASAAMVAGAAASASAIAAVERLREQVQIDPFWCMYAHTIVTSCTTITKLDNDGRRQVRAACGEMNVIEKGGARGMSDAPTSRGLR